MFERDSTSEESSIGDNARTRCAAIGEVRVLLVDDDDKYLRATKLNLERADFKVVTACDGEEALAALRQEKVEVVVSDIMMPNMLGTELLRKIREDVTLNDLHFILHEPMMCLPEDNSYLEGDSIARSGSGMSDWALTKTPSPGRLIHFIEEILGRENHPGMKKWREANRKISQRYDRWLAASNQAS